MITLTPVQMAEQIEDMAAKAIRNPADREAYIRDIRRQAKALVQRLKKGGDDHDHQ